MNPSRFHFTIKQKLQILHEFDENQSSACLSEKGISKAQVLDWKNKESEMMLIPEEKQSQTYILHSGPTKKYEELYTFLYTKIKEMRAEKQVVNHNLLITLACNEDPTIKIKVQTEKEA